MKGLHQNLVETFSRNVFILFHSILYPITIFNKHPRGRMDRIVGLDAAYVNPQGIYQFEQGTNDVDPNLRAELLTRSRARPNSHVRDFDLPGLRTLTQSVRFPGNRSIIPLADPYEQPRDSLLPGVWLTEAEQFNLQGVPFNGSLATALIRDDAVSPRAKGFITEIRDRDTQPREFFGKMSSSFRETLLGGLTYLEGGEVGAELRNQPMRGFSLRKKWRILTAGVAKRERMTKYLRLVVARYATHLVVNSNDPSQINGSVTFPGSYAEQAADLLGGLLDSDDEEGPIANTPVAYRLFNPTGSIFSYVPSLRRFAGFWGDSIKAVGLQNGTNEVRVRKNLDVIRRRIIEVIVGDDQKISWPTMVEVLYPIMRPTSLFQENDTFQCYYVRLHIFANADAEKKIPEEITIRWVPEHRVGVGIAAFQQIIDVAEETITQSLNSKDDPSNSSDYSFYIEATWIKDPALQLEFQVAMEDVHRAQDIVDAAREDVIESRPDQIIEGDEFAGEEDQYIPGGDVRNTYFLDDNRRQRLNPTSSSVAPVGRPIVPGRNLGRVREEELGGLGRRGGAYIAETLKERMFVKASCLNRFTETRALFQVPDRPHQTCILMSLFRAERRIYTFQSDGHLRDIHQGPQTTDVGDYEYLIPALDIEKWTSVDPKPAYLYRNPEDLMWYLRLSLPIKIPHPDKPGYFLGGDLTVEQEDLWEHAAEEMCAYMEHTLERGIDINVLDEVCQAFSDVFRIGVHIFDLECRGRRVYIYTPDKMEAKEWGDSTQGELQFISLVYDQGHCHAVADLQSFITNRHRSTKVKPYMVCPFCDKRMLSSSYTKSKAYEHISECYQSGVFKSGRDVTVKQNLATSVRPVRNSFTKKAGDDFVTKETLCSVCGHPVTQESYIHHRCVLPIRNLEPVPNNKLYVYDLEAGQVLKEGGVWEHVDNCVVVRKVYPETPEEEEGVHFEDVPSFMEKLLEEDSEYRNGVFLAHNGGGYDCQFLLKVLERWDIEHSFTPSPGSNHKFLEIRLVKEGIRLLDFMRFVGGSLRSIAKAFGCALAKGDFPHKFNNGERMNYRGPLPPHNPDYEDFWCQKHTKDTKQRDEFNKWYVEEACQEFCTCFGKMYCDCGRPPWVFREELIKYCRLDVAVLAEIVRLYREETMNLERGPKCPDSTVDWRPPSIDPFACVTLPQLTINSLAQGFMNPEDDMIQTLYQQNRGGMRDEAIAWLRLEEEKTPHKIFHRGNHIREYYDFELQMFLDGFCPETGEVYWYVDCAYWGCILCNTEHPQDCTVPSRRCGLTEIAVEFEYLHDKLREKYRKVHIKRHHEFVHIWDQLSRDDQESCHLFQFEEALYGGRTEVFGLYAKPELMGEDVQLCYHDVTSLYPSVYIKTLPTGNPTHLPGHCVEMERLAHDHPNPYYGYIRCHVIPNRHCKIGLLPQRDHDSKRLTFPVHPMTGVWGTEELRLACLHGYVIETIYEAYIWEENQRSDQHLRGYVSYFLRMKQEAEGWEKLGARSSTPDEEEQQEIIERLYIQNGHLGRIRPDRVKINPVKRALAKLYLNSLWGKFAQKEASQENMTVYGPAHFMEIWGNPAVNRETFKFRETAPGTFKCTFDTQSAYRRPVGHGNLLFGAKVTEHARCVLHTRILEIQAQGGEVLYCDTDSVIFAMKGGGKHFLGIGLGKWTDEYPKKKIREMVALAPKMYMLDFEEGTEVRAKGIPLTLRNKTRLQIEKVKPLLLPFVRGEMPLNESDRSIAMDNFSIRTNAHNTNFQYGTMLTIENHKDVRVVLSKREVIHQPDFSFTTCGLIQTLPIGYSPSH